MDDGNLWIALLLLLILITVNGILASAEIALVGLNEIKLKKRSDDGERKAKVLLKMKHNPSSFLSTIQIGITLAGLLSGAFAAETLAQPLVVWVTGMGINGLHLSIIKTVAVIFITLLLTYFMLVFGELVPKRIAFNNPEKIAYRFISPIAKLSVLTKPLVILLSASTNGILKLIGINPQHEQNPVTEEEIMLMIQEGHKQGNIEDTEVEVVSNIFKFTDQVVEDAMTHRTEIIALPVNGTLSDMADTMAHSSHSKFPVYDTSIDNIVGIVYAKDIVAVYARQETLKNFPIAKVMRAPYFVPESKLLVQLFADMKKNKNGIAIVADKYGGTSGLITIKDIVEEIVGDIGVHTEEDVVNNPDGTYIINGRMKMDDVRELLNISSDGNDYDTLSGFIIDILGYIPVSGQNPEIHFGGYSFRVADISGAMIQSVFIKKLPSDTEKQVEKI